MVSKASQPDIRSTHPGDLSGMLSAWGQPAYRAGQVLEWVHRRRVQSWDAMTNLPKGLRQQLADGFCLTPLELVTRQGSRDTTNKFLWRLKDGAMVESVLIPANPALYGEQSDRRTLCVSTQVGCAYGCKFCASGLDGWKRNLEAGEIVSQVLDVEHWFQQSYPEEAAGDRAIHNLVIMGMGEPMANFTHLMSALEILNSSWGGNIGARKITISTSGLAPRIQELARHPAQYRLAISLHGATNEVRDRIMPVNRKFPLEVLAAACEEYVREKGKWITLEYILIEGVNDGLDQTGPLARLAHRLHAKVNLIPYNTVEGLPWKRPAEPVQEAFLGQLKSRGVTATLRREKGHDIDAACGQLRLKTEKSQQAPE